MSNIWKPAIFQGRGKKDNYFEGWYFKLVDATEKISFALIPGISLTGDPETSHAFIMVFNARQEEMNYFEFPVEDFKAARDEFQINIGENSFSLQEVHLDLDHGENKVLADLNFFDLKPWPVTRLSPGVMGWYGFVPGMECYHGVLSFDHGIEGFIQVNDQMNNFTGGRGYMEKDWGKSMPSSWIWMQTNHFNQEGISLFGSIAKIPWMGRFFTGFIFGFLYQDHLYKFTTYNGARVDKLEVNKDLIEIRLSDKNYILEIDAKRSQGVDLPAPKMGEMSAKVNESLKSEINVKLYGEDLIFSGTGRNAGLEFVGDVEELLRGIKR
ncbi:MAG: tocopherol cyclase family protein [Methanomicrobiales archaeon]